MRTLNFGMLLMTSVLAVEAGIIPIVQERSVTGRVEVEEPVGSVVFSQSQVIAAPDFGLFDETLTITATSPTYVAESTSRQRSVIGTSAITGDFLTEVGFNFTQPDGYGLTTGLSTFRLEFEVDRAATYHLTTSDPFAVHGVSRFVLRRGADVLHEVISSLPGLDEFVLLTPGQRYEILSLADAGDGAIAFGGGDAGISFSLTEAVPEGSTVSLVVLGLAAFGAARRFKAAKHSSPN
jgi:hypothetical protein